MNILPRFIICNNGASGHAWAGSSKPKSMLLSLLCLLSRPAAAESAVTLPAVTSNEVIGLLRLVGATLGLMLGAGVLVSALLSDDYGRAVQVQVSGYSALSDKLTGSLPTHGLRGVTETLPNASVQRSSGF